MPTATRTNPTNYKITEHNVDGDVCDKCRRAYSAIYNVPEDVWLKIAPHPECLGEHNYGGGMLCPDCAATSAKAIGIRLIFVGERWEDSPAPAGKEAELDGYDEACETIGEGLDELCGVLGISSEDLEDDIAAAACISQALSRIAQMLKPLNLQLDRDEWDLKIPPAEADTALEEGSQ